MATRIDGDNVTVPGQVSVAGAATQITHVITRGASGVLQAYIKNLDLNAVAPVDLTTLPILSSRYVPLRCFLYNPTADVSAATLGLYTAASGGGVALVTPVLLANLTAVGTFQELTINVLTSVVTAVTLYPYLTVAAGAPGAASLVLEYQDLALI